MLEINKIVYSNYRELTNKINNYHYEGYKIIKLDLLDDGNYRLEFTLVDKNRVKYNNIFIYSALILFILIPLILIILSTIST